MTAMVAAKGQSNNAAGRGVFDKRGDMDIWSAMQGKEAGALHGKDGCNISGVYHLMMRRAGSMGWDGWDGWDVCRRALMMKVALEEPKPNDVIVDLEADAAQQMWSLARSGKSDQGTPRVTRNEAERYLRRSLSLICL